MVAVSGSDGCVPLVKKSDKSTELVVGSVKGNGIVATVGDEHGGEVVWMRSSQRANLATRSRDANRDKEATKSFSHLITNFLSGQ